MRTISIWPAACAVSLAVIGLSAQVPGTNVNMVTGTTFPGGDPFLQKQNEPSLAVSTRNPCTLLGGANDYRAVNLPGLPADREIGDAWVGLYKSTDCGQTWFSTLVPGYPQDTSAAGVASPVKGLAAAADPTVRSGPGGLFFYSFIAFNRGSNVGKYAVARFVDNNNREGGDPIQYLGTTLVDSGSAGQFLDKPIIAVSKGTGVCSIGGVTVQASVVHMAWTVFVGNSDQNIRTKVYYAKSSNCGVSLDGPPTKLSEGFPVNQGASIAVNPTDGNVLVAWRQFAAGTTNNAILLARSTDGGNSFTKGESIPFLNGFLPFDQGTTSKSFRTNAFPTIVADHLGRIHLALSVRRAVADQARVIHMSTADGLTWTMPTVVDPAHDVGHQIMPAFAFAAGKLHLVWYDLRETEAGKAYPAAFETFIREIFPIRHTLDVRGAVGTLESSNIAVTFQTYGVLQVPANATPRLSRYFVGHYGGSADLKQLQYNRPNLKLYAGGTAPFMGDFIDVAGLAFVPVRTSTGQTWELNDGATPARLSEVYHAVWTDNRDAVMGSASPEPVSDTAPTSTVGYAAPVPTLCEQPDPQALPTSRNANVYTSRITPGLFVSAPGNAKPTRCRAGSCAQTGGLIQRAFGVNVQNTTGQQRTFRLRIENQPPDAPTGYARFDQLAVGPPSSIFDDINVTVGPRSSAARSVYVTSGQKYPYILVTVLEQNPPNGTTPLGGAVILNPDISNPDISNPDISNPDISNNEIHNPDISNPDISNPDISNPDISNPDISNPDISNPDVQNPDISNPDISNPDISNPDISNPDISNPDISNGSLTDVSVEVTNDGNTTSTYQVGATVDGDTNSYLFQLIGRRVYKTPTARGCQLVEAATNQILFNVPNPKITAGLFDPNSSDVRNATIVLEPGETIKLTLRAWDKDVLTGSTAPADDGIQPFCPMLGDLCTTVTHNVTFTVQAQAYNNIDGVITTTGGRGTATISTTPFEVTTASLPGGIVQTFYSRTLRTSPGTSPFTWSVVAGALPSGLALGTENGQLSGAPTTAGTSNFTVRVQDAAGKVATRAFTVQVMTIASGDLVVADGGPSATGGAIYRVTPDGATTELIATTPGRPMDVAVDASRRVVVADASSAAVRIVTPGHVATAFSGAPLVRPVAVGIERTGNILVADNTTDAVYRLTPNALTADPDDYSIGDTPVLQLPQTPTLLQNIRIAFEGSGAAIVAEDSGPSVRIWRIDSTGATELTNVPTTITALGGLTVTGELIHVADYSAQAIYVLGPDGSLSSTTLVTGIGGNMTNLAVEGGGPYVVSINAPAAVKRVTNNDGTVSITTVKSGSPLTWLNSLALVAPPVILN